MSLRRAAVVFAAIMLPAAPAPAATPSFALKPVGHAGLGYYRFHAVPGQTVSGRLRVVNAGTVTGTAELAVVDATTGATTGAVYETVGGRSDDVGAWLALGAPRVTLAPGASRIVTFRVHVPADGRRGQHLGGIVARPLAAAADATQGKAKHNFRVTIVDQAIVAVQLDLPGAARRLLAVRGVQAGGNTGYQTLVLALSNPGEMMVKGRGTVTITTAGGAPVKRQDFAIDTFLPRTRIAYPLVMRGKALLPGDYRAKVGLNWSGGHASSVTLPFKVTRKNIAQAYGSKGLAQLPGAGTSDGPPIALLAGGGVLVLLLGFGSTAWYFRRRTRELERRFALAVPEPEGEIGATDAREPAERV